MCVESSANVRALVPVGLLLSLLITGAWSGQAAAAGGCRFPGAPAHSNVIFSDETLGPGTVATYTCERGFELLGPSRRTCEMGQWLPEGIPFCVLNVAAGKAPMQVSTELGGIPQKAIDGSTSAFFNADTCTLTKSERNPWWYVNLLEPYMVQLVRLDFGKPCCGTNKPATIIVRVGNNRPDLGTNPICNRFTGFLEEGQPLFLPCNPPMPGAFVSVHLESPTANQLSICEAFVYTDQALPIERCPQFRDQPPGSTATYNGKCYIFYNRQPLKFRDALSFCRSRGGTLVDESNPALQGFISWELWRRHRSDASGQYWMGAIRDKTSGGWNWLRGEEVTVSFWNLPVGTGECSRYDGTKGWLWSDTDCLMHLNYICQHKPKACGRPEQPPNSTMIAPNFNVDTAIEYSCDEGHLLVGPTSRTCLDTGFYNEFPPVCKRIQCGYPADIANGEYNLVNDSVGYLSRVIYSCEEGYEMVGRAQLACDIDERWNGPPPRCDAVLCEIPAIIEHGSYETTSNETIYGTLVTYSCDPGYNLLGPKILTCMANGQYDAMPPMCQEDENVSTTPTPTPTPFITKATRPLPTTRARTRPTRPAPTTIRAETEVIRLSERPKRPSSTRTPVMSTTTTTTLFGGITTEQPILPPTINPQIILAGHPQDNEIAGSSNVQQGETPNVNVPLSIDGIERREPYGAKLNMGAIIALGAFGGFIFLAAIITTIVILVRRNRSAKHYRHRASPDCNTVASFDSSSSESRNGLNRYYRQAWENLHESSGKSGGNKGGGGGHQAGGHSPLRRKETLDERHRDGSELVVSSAEQFGAGVGGGSGGAGGGGAGAGGGSRGEKKRHHHHHHHHNDGGQSRLGGGKEWRQGENHRSGREHKRY